MSSPPRFLSSGPKPGWLKLQSQPGRGIRVGDEVYVMISEIRGQRVKLAILAPKHVRVVRTELLPKEERP